MLSSNTDCSVFLWKVARGCGVCWALDHTAHRRLKIALDRGKGKLPGSESDALNAFKSLGTK